MFPRPARMAYRPLDIHPRTVAGLPKALPATGRFMVLTATHRLAFIDGEVCDWTAGRRHRPLYIFEMVV